MLFFYVKFWIKQIIEQIKIINITNTELIIKYFLILIKSSPVDKRNTITAPLKNVKKIVIGNMLYCNLKPFMTSVLMICFI